MAIIQCHECSGQVSDQAATCPHCGAPVFKAPAKAVPQHINPVAGILVGLMVVGSLAWCSSSSSDKPETKAEADCHGDLQCAGEKTIGSAGVYCKDSIEKLAKHSVKWKDESMFAQKFSRYR